MPVGILQQASNELKLILNHTPRSLAALREGEEGVLETLDLPDDIATRLMELGFLPGARIRAGRAAPGGDPRVFEVDGSDVAIRRETASRLVLRNTR
jgi:Fe2+ transport system protein FeoA